MSDLRPLTTANLPDLRRCKESQLAKVRGGHVSVRRRRKNRLVVEVESLVSTSKENIKRQRTFNKNYCDLLTAITHAKILAAYFIISDKRTEV